jgi:2-oxo-3-hexenedioate decarboxylase
MIDAIERDAIANECLAVLDSAAQIAPFTKRYAGIPLSDAYAVAARLRDLRSARGEKPVGRKIGFTNRGIWAEYNVSAPIWGYMYDKTVHELRGTSAFSLAHFTEPRIEPEIVFALKAAPSMGMDDAALGSCIEWIAPGFEVVQSIFPGWKFAAADTVVGAGLHAALLIGERCPVDGADDQWLAKLLQIEVELLRNDDVVDLGRATNVLEGPLSAIRHLIEVLAGDPHNPSLAAGEIITTGTMTRAFPIAAGEAWSARFSKGAFTDIEIRFT